MVKQLKIKGGVGCSIYIRIKSNSNNMKKFLVLYLAPVTVLEEWSKMDPEKRKIEEEKMRKEWSVWMKEFGGSVKETAGAGKTKRVTKGGTADVKNDIMLFSFVEADSPEVAAKMFKNHPHLNIPQASIEIMPVGSLSDME